jgi:hypothetical protein
LQLGLFILFFTVAIAANAQISGKSIPEIKHELQVKETMLQPTFSLITPSTFQLFTPSTLQLFTPSTFPPFNFSTKSDPPIHLSSYLLKTDIPNLHTYEHLPFFCKVEVKLEQAAKFPIKFRLGDVPYVDYLEGKRARAYW